MFESYIWCLFQSFGLSFLPCSPKRKGNAKYCIHLKKKCKFPLLWLLQMPPFNYYLFSNFKYPLKLSKFSPNQAICDMILSVSAVCITYLWTVCEKNRERLKIPSFNFEQFWTILQNLNPSVHFSRGATSDSFVMQHTHLLKDNKWQSIILCNRKLDRKV